MESIIRAAHLRKSFGEKTAVDDLSFDIKKGEFFGLLGSNGAGKSTTIDCLLGLKKQDEGNVSILGMNPRTNRKKLFERVGVQLQQSCYQDKIKVSELCEETAVLYKHTANYKNLLERFSLSKVENQFVPTLSGGERQKLSILLALIPEPEVVFLDELTTGLDTAARREVWKMLNELKQKDVTVLLTSHFMDEVETLCDRICILKDGKEVVSGEVTKVIESSPYQRLEEAYLWYMGEEVQS